MILQTLKSNRIVNLILFPLFGILFWIKSFLAPFSYQFFPGENENTLYSPVVNLVQNSDYLQVALSLILVLFIAFLIQQVNDRFLLLRIRIKLPATIFVLIVGGITTMHTSHPVYFAAIFLLLAINSFFEIFNNPKPFPHIFNAGLFIGIGSLFYFNLVIILPAFLIAIVILRREVKWREFLILVIGFILPFIFALGYAFLTEQLLALLATYEQSIITPINHFRDNYPLHAFLTLLIIFTVLGSFKLLKQYDSRKVSTRKYYSIFLLIFIFSMISFAFIPAASQEMLVIAVIPVTLLISNFFASMISKFWGNFLFTLLIIAVVLMQFSDQLF